MTSSDFDRQRLKKLENNITQEQKLLHEYEDKLRFTSDPREIARLKSEIERQENAIANLRQKSKQLENAHSEASASLCADLGQDDEELQDTEPVPISNEPNQKKQKETFEVIFSILQNQENLRWPKLKTVWQQKWGGELSEIRPSGDYWSFTWSNVKSQNLLEEAERGVLDREFAQHGGKNIIEILKNDECVYQFVPQVSFNNEIEVQGIRKAETEELASKVDVLLLTVTEIERKAVLSMMRPLPLPNKPDGKKILRGSMSLTYRFGQFGEYYVAQTESTMGGGGRAGARNTLTKALNELKPKVVLLLGIAFGVDRKKQRLCDVLIGEAIHFYEAAKIKEGTRIDRGERTQCGLILSERFRMLRDDWQIDCGARSVKVHQGLMVSGNKLIDDQNFRDSLIQTFPQLVGGEMEGAGAYEAAAAVDNDKKPEIILVKGICDWADGTKNDRAQPYAAYAAVSLAHHVLSQPDVLHRLGVQGVEDPEMTPSVINNYDRGKLRALINGLEKGERSSCLDNFPILLQELERQRNIEAPVETILKYFDKKQHEVPNFLKAVAKHCPSTYNRIYGN